MQKLFGVSLTTLNGYATFFSVVFGALTTSAAIKTWPTWALTVCGVGFTLSGALVLATAHFMNDAPPPPANPPAAPAGNQP